jgi:hypothetical protein
MNITVSEELRAYIDPLTPHEHEALERSLLAEGCRDALVLWGNVLVDGHNRYGICSRLGIAFNTVQNTQFKSMDDVHLWMIDQHLGRRSLSDFQRGVLALRRKDILSANVPAGADSVTPESSTVAPTSNATSNHVDAMTTSYATAKAARLSSSTLSHIKKIQETAAPELVAAVKSGSISITAAANVASLPVVEQVAAAAGGKKELQQAARQVRESRAVERSEPDSPAGVIARLKQTITTLSAENAALKAQLAELNG